MCSSHQWQVGEFIFGGVDVETLTGENHQLGKWHHKIFPICVQCSASSWSWTKIQRDICQTMNIWSVNNTCECTQNTVAMASDALSKWWLWSWQWNHSHSVDNISNWKCNTKHHNGMLHANCRSSALPVLRCRWSTSFGFYQDSKWQAEVKIKNFFWTAGHHESVWHEKWPFCLFSDSGACQETTNALWSSINHRRCWNPNSHVFGLDLCCVCCDTAKLPTLCFGQKPFKVVTSDRQTNWPLDGLIQISTKRLATSNGHCMTCKWASCHILVLGIRWQDPRLDCLHGALC